MQTRFTVSSIFYMPYNNMNEFAQLTDNERKVVGFIRMVEQRQSADELETYYHPEAEQQEYPNAVTKTTAVRNLNDLKLGAERGRKIMSKEEYDIKNLYSIGDTVILEAVWKGTVSIPIGNIPAGGQMVAHFAQIFEFKEGKIYRQRNYDCFESF